MAHTSFLIQLPDKVVRDERDESRALLQQFGPSGPRASSSVLLDRLSRSLTTLVLTKLFVSGCISLLVALSASTRRQQSIECTLAAITAVVTLLSYVKIVMIRAEGSRRMQELLARGSTEATTPAAIATAASLECPVLYGAQGADSAPIGMRNHPNAAHLEFPLRGLGDFARPRRKQRRFALRSGRRIDLSRVFRVCRQFADIDF
jgi:hypothetical protein